MSEVFNKSRENNSYFTTRSLFEQQFRKYSLETETIAEIKRPQPQYIPPIGGGVPMSGDIENKVVYVDQTDAHTLVFGATGSKKSRLVAMPTIRVLGAAKESMIISDPKAEIYERTAGYLDMKSYDVKVINFREPKFGNTWNPLEIPYQFFLDDKIDEAYEFANDIALNLAMRENSQHVDPFWKNSFHSFLLGLIVWVFHACKENPKGERPNMDLVIEFRKAMFEDVNDSEVNIIVTLEKYPYGKYLKNDFIKTKLMGILSCARDTRRSILATFDEIMSIFTLKHSLTEMLSSNTINIENITKTPTALYLIMPDEKTSYHGLVSLFIKQSYEYLIFTSQKSNNEQSLRVNYILDEFSSLPEISDFPAMITAARSRKIRFNIFLQSQHQLQLRYKEEAETIKANCTNWIFLTSRELALLEEISSLCGKKTKGENRDPILSVADLQRLDKDNGEALILSGRLKPFIATLIDIERFDKNHYRRLEMQYRTNK
jgi:type IV secretion system protein VirD4